MTSYRQILYHIVFRTKKSGNTIRQEHVDQLYAYIGGTIKKKDCHLLCINGTENHLHILTDLHPSIALADFMRDIKVYSSMWMKGCGLFPHFSGWAEGYAALTCSYYGLHGIIEYIKKQQEHHKKESFEDEYRKLLIEYGINIDERYFP